MSVVALAKYVIYYEKKSMNEDFVSMIQGWAYAITAEKRSLVHVDVFPLLRDQKCSWAR